jgi:epoxide hydrolase-like predicted phosphatase
MAVGEPGGTSDAPPRRGLLVDFGGVLTTDIFASFTAFCELEGLEPDIVAKLFRHDPAGRQLLFDLETGAMPEEEFEPKFAALLGLSEERGPGLIDRLFGGMRPDHAMLNAVRAAKDAGVKTGLLSNSWGKGRYDRSQFPVLFDGVVISGEVGVRKPDEAIYKLAAESVGLAAKECVFVDDLAGNLKPARDLGMATVHHTSAGETVPQLEKLLGVRLR